MLLEFSVTNYRSIRDTQTLRMAASRYYKNLEETICFIRERHIWPNRTGEKLEDFHKTSQTDNPSTKVHHLVQYLKSLKR